MPYVYDAVVVLIWVRVNPSIFWNGFIEPINFMGCSKKEGTYFEERILLSSRYDTINPSFENPSAAIMMRIKRSLKNLWECWINQLQAALNPAILLNFYLCHSEIEWINWNMIMKWSIAFMNVLVLIKKIREQRVILWNKSKS